MSTQEVSTSSRIMVPRTYLSLRNWEFLGTGLFNLLVYSLLFLYLFPIIFMVSASFMESVQLRDRNAPPYPARQLRGYPHYELKTFAGLGLGGDRGARSRILVERTTTGPHRAPQRETRWRRQPW